MACYHPITAYRSQHMNENGKFPLTFRLDAGWVDLTVNVPCGRCIGCRLDKARQWAVRCYHESLMHSKNCFVTLTYDDEHFPSDGSVHLEHFQKFMKRFRKRFGKVRFFHCGEYGTNFGRPHYHCLLFGFDFSDKRLFKVVKKYRYYVSDILSSLWTYGHHVIADCTYNTIFYTAKYCMKKVVGKNADEHYKGRKPEYVTMSRRPGLGRDFYDRYKNDLYSSDMVVLDAKHKFRVPKFYDKLLDLEDKDFMDDLKRVRFSKARKYHGDFVDYKRLFQLEEVKLEKSKMIRRTYEDV